MKLQLKPLRKARGMTQTDLADAIGTTMRVMSAWERGADVLECTLDELAGREWRGEKFGDPGKNALVGYYDSMNERGRATLVESARLMSDGDSVRIEKDREEHAGISTAMGA